MFPVDEFTNKDYVFLCGKSTFVGDQNILTHEVGHWFGMYLLVDVLTEQISLVNRHTIPWTVLLLVPSTTTNSYASFLILGTFMQV